MSSEIDHIELEKLLRHARAFVKRGDLNAALGIANQLVEKYPESTSAHELLGDIYYAMGKTGKARAHYKRALEIEPANADAERKFAEALLNTSVEEQRAAMIRGVLSGSVQHNTSSRRPLNAVVAALLFPGWGQLYNREYEKGLAIFSTSVIILAVLFYGAILKPWQVMAQARGPAPLTIANISAALHAMPGSYTVLIMVGIFAYIAGYIYCIWDALSVARRQFEDHQILGI